MLNLFRKKKLRKRVLILNTLPHTRSTFDLMCESGTSDFLRSMANGAQPASDDLWSRWQPSLKQLLATLRKLSDMGADVIHHATPAHISRLAGAYDIVVIIAHHSDNSDEIEIDGRLMATQTLVESFPTDMTATVDITSCHSAHIIPKLLLRSPGAHFVGINMATSLDFRLLLLEETIALIRSGKVCDYRNALRMTLDKLRKAINLPDGLRLVDESKADKIQLGTDSLKSSVFAPASVRRGSDFIVQLFIHSDSESGDVEVTARMIDDSSSVRNSKSLNFKIEESDKIDFQLIQLPRQTDDFEIEDEVKGFIWNGAPASVEFCVSVPMNCSKDAFIGKIKIAVNKMPVGDIMFRTAVTDPGPRRDNSCAGFDFNNHSRHSYTAKAKRELIEHLESILANLRNGSNASARDINICMKCIELLKENRGHKNPILRVFISSTSDMRPYRMIIKEQVDSCAMFADMYEFWGQGNDYPRDLCCKHVLESDIFVCILGSQYGYVEPCWGLSMTEIEYRTAEQCDMPILVYIDENWQKEIDSFKADPALADKARSQEALIDELKVNRMVHFFHNENKLASQAIAELLTLKYTLFDE